MYKHLRDMRVSTGDPIYKPPTRLGGKRDGEKQNPWYNKLQYLARRAIGIHDLRLLAMLRGAETLLPNGKTLFGVT